MLPLTFERYRICELYAELLHCSNMSLLNRSAEFNHLYDDEGRLSGGLPALEELARVISIGSVQDPDVLDQNTDEVEPALELPITTGSHDSPSLIDSDEDMSDDEPGSSDDEAMEEITLYDDVVSRSPGTAVLEETLPPPPSIVPSSPNAASLPPPAEIAAQGAALGQHRKNSLSRGSSSDVSATGSRLHGSRRNTRRTTLAEPPDASLPIGEKLKQKFLEMNILSTLLVGPFKAVTGLILTSTLRTYSSNFLGTISCTA
jgi:serine/threonine-protein phosphatase 6 regulatory subunit 3